jgi:hypothetical protein
MELTKEEKLIILAALEGMMETYWNVPDFKFMDVLEVHKKVVRDLIFESEE